MTKNGVVDWWVSINTVTGSIARNAKRRYSSNSEADFWGFSARRGNTLHRWGWNCQLTAKKTATGNENLQPEIEINDYSSSNKLLE